MLEKANPAAANSGALDSLPNTQYRSDISASPAFQDQFDRIPLELRERVQWLVWRVEQVSGRQTKVPYTPNTIKHASSTHANTWRTFDECVAAVREKAGWNGIGFVFTEGDEYAGVDFDYTDDPAIFARHQQWAERLNSYSERSPSKTGLHVIVKGSVPKGINSRGRKIEVYSSGRFFTMTGDVYRNAPISDRNAELNTLWAELNAERATVDDASVVMDVPQREDDQTILDRASRADNGDKFTRVWNGDLSDYANDHSRADAALCELLAFYTSSAEQIARLWIGSPWATATRPSDAKTIASARSRPLWPVSLIAVPPASIRARWMRSSHLWGFPLSRAQETHP